MLAKPNRLTKDKEIKDLIKTGKSLFLPAFVIKYKHNNLNNIKIGIIVSTKVDKRAVVRNKIKRQIRAIIRKNISDIEHGHSLLIIVKKQALGLEYKKIEKTLVTGLVKINILNNNI